MVCIGHLNCPLTNFPDVLLVKYLMKYTNDKTSVLGIL